MKLTLHRSLTFWSGILVMLFIAWAWRDSLKSQSWMGNRSFVVMNVSAFVALHHQTDPPIPIGAPAPRFETRREALPRLKGIEDPLLPPPLFLRGGGENIHDFMARGESMKPVKTSHELQRNLIHFRPRADWSLLIPHWLLLAGVGVAWAGLLAWRAKRRNR